MKILFTDNDGVLTDSNVYYSKWGAKLKKYSVRDGMAVEMLKKIGVETIILTKEKCKIAKKRAKKLKIKCYSGIQDKKAFIVKYSKKKKIKASDIYFIGDDINDIKSMLACKFSACPADAIAPVQKSAKYVSRFDGGKKAFRDIAEYIIKNVND